MIPEELTVFGFEEIVCLTIFFPNHLSNLVDVVFAEQQPFGNHHAFVDKRPGLFGAMAGIDFFNKTAFVIHKIAYILAGTGQFLAEINATHFEYLRSDFISNIQNFPKNKNQPLLTVKAEQHSEHAADFCFLDNQTDINRQTRPVRNFHVGGVINASSILRKGTVKFLVFSGFHIDYVVGGNAVNPGSKTASLFEC